MRRKGIRKIRSREAAKTKEGTPLPIPWKKLLRFIWMPSEKNVRANMYRAVVPPDRKMVSVPNREMIWVGKSMVTVQHRVPQARLVSAVLTTISPTRSLFWAP